MPMSTPKLVHDAGLSTEQFDLIQRFEADYNAVDQSLRKALGKDKQVSFTELVRRYADKHPNWRDDEMLRTIADIRNIIVHGKTEPYHYVAIPTPTIAEEEDRYRSEETVYPARPRRMAVQQEWNCRAAYANSI